ncbi:hypothetical protein AcW1_007303 [Taiwanofungus camphoratus]|nr:hypothetical protein AcW2_007630 [Antrodia cinnamomea]KAI0927460.1 hypothetical protein AcV5_007996 [Antrodia cinnamomea]KAI0952957.1 hypothetical protein AcW1_007303 [Antrodia cinnamomea]
MDRGLSLMCGQQTHAADISLTLLVGMASACGKETFMPASIQVRIPCHLSFTLFITLLFGVRTLPGTRVMKCGYLAGHGPGSLPEENCRTRPGPRQIRGCIRHRGRPSKRRAHPLSQMSSSSRSAKLLALLELLNQAVQTVVKEWDQADALATDSNKSNQNNGIPSSEQYNARRTIMAACGAFTELVQPPEDRLIEIAAQFSEARALHIVVEHNVAEHLAEGDQKIGVSIGDLSNALEIHPQKLGRIMRMLCSIHIFSEVQDGHFVNNDTSACLVQNEALKAFIRILSLIYTANDKLPDILRNPAKCYSDDATCTAFQEAFGTELSFWDWLESGIKLPYGRQTRPELEMVSKGFVGQGRAQATSVYYDFPWQSLRSGVVVDIGGGVGGMSFDLCTMFPSMKLVVQDRAQIIDQARSFWKREQPDALEKGRVQLIPHDFFKENPIKGADAYILRYILHDWGDERCVDILRAIRSVLSPHSRVLIIGEVMNTTLGCPEIASAPYPLLANYGTFARYAHHLGLAMMGVFNGAERTPNELRALAERAGLEVTCIWECRSSVHVTEMMLSKDLATSTET